MPGIVQWDAFRETIGRRVHSTFVLSSGTLIDPMAPDGDGGLDAVAELATPRRIVLSNRLHYRDSARYAKRFGCPVLCHEAGLSHFADDRPVQGFSFDEQLADDVRALELGSICAEETTLLLDVAGGALAFGDGLTRDEDGALTFMPDQLLGDDARGRAGGAREEAAKDARRGGLRHVAVRARRARVGRGSRALRGVPRRQRVPIES